MVCIEWASFRFESASHLAEGGSKVAIEVPARIDLEPRRGGSNVAIEVTPRIYKSRFERSLFSFLLLNFFLCMDMHGYTLVYIYIYIYIYE